MEHQSQSLSICNRFYNFIARSLSTHAFKTVTLGHPAHPISHDAKPKSPSEHPFASLSSVSKDQDNNCHSLSAVEGTDIKIHGEEGNVSVAAQSRTLKKAVSINDSVEEIDTRKKKLKGKKSFEKISSFEQEDEPKPLRSILKEGSNLGGKSNSLVNLFGKDES
ncbi:hypothetical protein K2173_027183 [Erythroxylum novogranatense]|uniref:Uncharacterized protein n=1 Tax=Erythroxylum novogranatense TaxID=1862640 RepID=A0AAV8TZQ5_9ROSI|nr:hypothetical protein K2173_027183 [Erythroxylum novogranatense]